MTTIALDKKWFDEFIVELRLRDVLGYAIGDAVASARELLDDTGHSAVDTFGPAREYAESLELPREPGKSWSSRRLWPSILGVVAFTIFVQTFSAWTQNESILISPAQLALIAAPGVLVAFLPFYLQFIIRRRWLAVPLVLIGGALGYLTSIATPATPAGAWLTLDPIPWLLGTAMALILLSLWNTVQTLRRGTIDAITEPLSAQPTGNSRGVRAFVMLTNWLFPALAAVMGLVIFLITR